MVRVVGCRAQASVGAGAGVNVRKEMSHMTWGQGSHRLLLSIVSATAAAPPHPTHLQPPLSTPHTIHVRRPS
jgi:hypothetical protein